MATVEQPSLFDDPQTTPQRAEPAPAAPRATEVSPPPNDAERNRRAHDWLADYIAGYDWR